MHDCLLLPDIFHRILDFVELELPVDFYASHTQLWWKNRSLARLARTCRAFQEPSLNVLWKRQYTLGPLVRTLPEDAWEEEVICVPEPYNQADRKCHHLTIKRPLSLSDWRRFDYYARRIQSLGYLDFEFADQEGLSWAFPNLTVCDRPIDVTQIFRLALYRRNRWLLQ
ncbi:hypothetical protein NUW54_g7760 [Trametes sanguinea]|uniref:Uncharacterized protein n=1 Tax=Trametes sanguinea TaxID=158606 RepID=A0ACC1PJA7_9APHY|nr:hypothetical protein NUW54_g7760 [Trametes sanguinea]